MTVYIRTIIAKNENPDCIYFDELRWYYKFPSRKIERCRKYICPIPVLWQNVRNLEGKANNFRLRPKFFDSLLGKVPKEKLFSITFDWTELQQSVCEANLHYWEDKGNSSICMMERNLHCFSLGSLG